MKEKMDLKEAFERIEYQINEDLKYNKMTTAGFMDVERIKQALDELQAYKDREYKLREMFKSEKLENLNKYYYGDSYELDAHELRKDILQILNKEER